MAIQKLLFIMVLSLSFHLLDLTNAHAPPSCLKLGFYAKTCPSMEAIVSKVTYQYISQTPSLAASLLRMHFHDCFVRGCDGSVLLKSRNNIPAERDAIPNLTLRGFEVIDAVKSALEKKFPHVVSCADILAMVARDAIYGPYWEVPTGRRDGSVSVGSETFGNLPPPFANLTLLKQNFTVKALLDNAETKAYVEFQSTMHGKTFAVDFANFMVKLGKIGVLIGKAAMSKYLDYYYGFDYFDHESEYIHSYCYEDFDPCPVDEPNRVLHVTIHHILYSITKEVLHQVFSPYGYVERIVGCQKLKSCFKALIQFQFHQSAFSAKSSLQGRNIYDSCCQLDIQY
ncbi:hypothetical protein Ddye_017591 [Dipteronia dyeriana]|uniref:Peroxidase n=1 Tax=Dipteronia dyeriana TaxID=168575 RepID=A0AAD9X1B1_9ROSI|nr:hypothetical protein Ddye_017591 [Dipteronia dyeriana]